jgi:hypothetical protein
MKRSFLLFLAYMAVFTACNIGGGTGKPTSLSTPTPLPASTPTPTSIVPPTTATILVQLQTVGGSNYLVDQMTVPIQKAGGSVLTGATGTDGIARITVAETGDYQVVKADGIDAYSNSPNGR